MRTIYPVDKLNKRFYTKFQEYYRDKLLKKPTGYNSRSLVTMTTMMRMIVRIAKGRFLQVLVAEVLVRKIVNLVTNLASYEKR